MPDGEPVGPHTKRNDLSTFCNRTSKRNFARRNNTALGPEDRLKFLSKLWILVENTQKIMMKKSKSNVNGALQRFMCAFLALRVSYRCADSTPTPSYMPCVPLTSPADELRLQSIEIDGCGSSSVIKIVKMKYNRIDIKM